MIQIKEARRSRHWAFVVILILLGSFAQPAVACDVLDRGKIRYFTGFVVASHYCPFRKKPIDAAQFVAILHALKWVTDTNPTEGNCMEILTAEQDAALAIAKKDMEGVCNWAKGELDRSPVLQEFFSSAGAF
jgi:hypothetical protein